MTGATTGGCDEARSGKAMRGEGGDGDDGAETVRWKWRQNIGKLKNKIPQREERVEVSDGE